MNLLIYDIAGTHFNNVKKTVEFYQSGESEIFRYWEDFSETAEIGLLEFCLENNVKVVAIPYAQVNLTYFQNLLPNGIACVTPYTTWPTSSFRQYNPRIQIKGGTTEPEPLSHGTVIAPMLDFWGEIDGSLGLDVTAPSYVTGMVAAQVLNLMDIGYDAWEAREIMRLNAEGEYTVEGGFGKLPQTIEPIDNAEVFPLITGIDKVEYDPELGFILKDSAEISWQSRTGDIATNLGTFTDNPFEFKNQSEDQQTFTLEWGFESRQFTLSGSEPTPADEPESDDSTPEQAINPIQISKDQVTPYKTIAIWHK